MSGRQGDGDAARAFGAAICCCAEKRAEQLWADNIRLRLRNAELRSMLRLAEWPAMERRCVACGADYGQHEPLGTHNPGCELAEVLR